MEETIQRNINCLPVEVLINIFQFTAKLAGVDNLSTCALVCKSWLHPVQSVLYSDVKITKLPQLEKFNNTAERSSYLGEKVKVLTLKISLYQPSRHAKKVADDQTPNLLSNLLSFCLPNVKEIISRNLDWYALLLKALQESKLKHLKRISGPPHYTKKEELVNYASCIILMRDRIEGITINENLKIQNSHSLPTKRLYDSLGQFKNLTELKFTDNESTAVRIKESEYVLSTCKILKCLQFYYKEPENAVNPNSAISTFTPSYSIKLLRVFIYLRNYRDIQHLLHKFPEVCSIQLEMDVNSPTIVGARMLFELLNFSHRFEGYFSAYALRIDTNHDISKTLGDHWKKTSKPGKEKVEVVYGYVDPQRMYTMKKSDEYYLDFEKLKNENTVSYIFMYPERTFQQNYMHFIKKNGKYIGDIKFTLSEMHENTLTGIPPDFVAHAFKHCPNIQTLSFERNELKLLDYSKIDLCKKILLDELGFKSCTFLPGSLDRLSLLIPKVKRLRLYVPESTPYFTYTQTIEIIMLHTKMDFILFTDAREFFLELFVENDAKYYYYQFFDEVFKDSNKQEYTEADGLNTRVFVGCQTKPRLQWKRQPIYEKRF